METLHVVACVSNPLRWRSRIVLARAAIADWLKSPAVHVTVVECAFGDRPHELADLVGPRLTHVPVRATTMAWNKECLMNIGIARLPADAAKVATLDADVHFRRPSWATDTLAALDLYPVVQPWSTAYDLGPSGEHVALHHSFASLWHAGKPVVPTNQGKFATGPNGVYAYPHPGFAWAWKRSILDRIGGLFELGGMGAGDHHMACGMLGMHHRSLHPQIGASYRATVAAWSERATREVNGKLGFVHGTIEHSFHGRKVDRQYWPRWKMFTEHAFCPVADLKKNSYGVIEFAGNKPNLERAFDRYLRAREEDVNTLT